MSGNLFSREGLGKYEVQPEKRRYQALIAAVQTLDQTVQALPELDGYRSADRWLPLILEATEGFLESLIALKRDVDAFVKKHPNLSAGSQWKDLDRVELLDDLQPLGLFIDLLLHRREAVVGTPVEPVAVVRDVVQTLQERVLDLSDVESGVEFVADAVVDEGHHAHESTGAPREKP